MTVHKLESVIKESSRVMQVRGMFDLNEDHGKQTIINHEELNLNKPWNVGLIVGPSGSGKSTVAAKTFGITETKNPDPETAVVDLFPKELTTDEITSLLTSVGFSSPPAWLRSPTALSIGERFRVETALALATNKNKIVCLDEFTSVVDRTVAQIGSHAVAKHVRRTDQQLVAVSCHYDIAEWLQPDWTLDMVNGQFSWRSVQPRPQVNVEISRCHRDIWKSFSRHHYLSDDLASSCRTWLATVNGIPAALLGEMRQPHAKAKNIRRCSRIVVTPDFQGLGLGRIFLDTLGGAYKEERERFTITTSHPGMIGTLNRSVNWALTLKGHGFKSFQKAQQKTDTPLKAYNKRYTMSFQYMGQPNQQHHNQLLGNSAVNTRL